MGNISGSSVLATEKIPHKQAVELLAVNWQEAKGGIWSGSRHHGRAGEPGKWAGCAGKGRAGPLSSHLGSLRGRSDVGLQRRGGWRHLGPDCLFLLGSDSLEVLLMDWLG